MTMTASHTMMSTDDICQIKRSTHGDMFGCSSELPYKCKQNYCTKTKQACDLHMNYNRNMRSFKNLWNRNRIYIMSRSIRACPIGEQTDVCLNDYLCSKKKIISYCSCNQKFNFKCEARFCATSSRACEQFVSYGESVTMDDVNKCGIYSVTF